jgi:hypothetical protein
MEKGFALSFKKIAFVGARMFPHLFEKFDPQTVA